MEQALLPPPRKLDRSPGHWHAPNTVAIHAPGVGQDAPGFGWLREAFQRMGCSTHWTQSASEAQLLVEENKELAREAYELDVTYEGIVLRAASEVGLQHGLATLSQWITLCKREFADEGDVACVRIADEPALGERGVMLDVARGKRPRLETLKGLVDRLARWKINRLQLYMEADFAFAGADAALAGRSPYTPDEIRELDQFARARHIELVPNQQSFGHLHSWLKHPAWNALAEVPEGVEHPFSKQKEPFSLNATDPRSLEFLAGLYDKLLPCFSSQTVNVGLDETFDLGQGASRERCEELGKAQVYLRFMNDVHGLLQERGKHMQYWGDIVLNTPECIEELPRDATAMVWGYEADFPFEQQLPYFALAKIPFQVCPGTSSWNSLGGRVTCALGNLRKAALCARDTGARGILITDWGDRGHLQPWPVAYFGWVLGAACAWNPDAAAEVELDGVRHWLDRWAFEDEADVMGSALIALGSTSQVLQDDCQNGNALFFHLVFADKPFPDERMGTLEPAQVADAIGLLEASLADLASARSGRADAQLLCAELTFARDALLLSADLLQERMHNTRAGDWRELPDSTLKRLRKRLTELRRMHAELWGQRFRPGGLHESLEWLDILKTD